MSKFINYYASGYHSSSRRSNTQTEDSAVFVDKFKML